MMNADDAEEEENGVPRLSLTTGGGGGRANQWPMAVARGAPGGDDGDP